VCPDDGASAASFSGCTGVSFAEVVVVSITDCCGTAGNLRAFFLKTKYKILKFKAH